MKCLFQGAVILICLSVLFSLFGCDVADGPNMVGTPYWESFELCVIQNTHYRDLKVVVTDDDHALTVHGVWKDADGNVFENTIGIPLSYETQAKLRNLKLDALEEEPISSDAYIANRTSLVLIYKDNRKVRKAISSECVDKLCEVLSPYLVQF